MQCATSASVRGQCAHKPPVVSPPCARTDFTCCNNDSYACETHLQCACLLMRGHKQKCTWPVRAQPTCGVPALSSLK